MRTTLLIDDGVFEEARHLAAAEHRSVGAVISDLARRSLAPVGIRDDDGFPVFDVAADAPTFDADRVDRALDDE